MRKLVFQRFPKPSRHIARKDREINYLGTFCDTTQNFKIYRAKRLLIGYLIAGVLVASVVLYSPPPEALAQQQFPQSEEFVLTQMSNNVHSLTVSSFSSTSNTRLINQEVDAILRAASRILQLKDSPADMPCPVEFRRAGPVVAFTDGDGSIETWAELDQVLSLPAHIKIVEEINFCRGWNPGAIGCTRENSIVVERLRSDDEALLWLHEIGHSRSLLDRNDPRAIMNPSPDSNHTDVNCIECIAFR